MRGGSWAMALVVLLGVLGESQAVSQEADQQPVSQQAGQPAAEMAPLEVLQDCIAAVAQKDFVR